MLHDAGCVILSVGTTTNTDTAESASSRQQSVIGVRIGKSLPCATSPMNALEIEIRSDGQDALATGSRLVRCC